MSGKRHSEFCWSTDYSFGYLQPKLARLGDEVAQTDGDKSTHATHEEETERNMLHKLQKANALVETLMKDNSALKTLNRDLRQRNEKSAQHIISCQSQIKQLKDQESNYKQVLEREKKINAVLVKEKVLVERTLKQKHVHLKQLMKKIGITTGPMVNASTSTDISGTEIGGDVAELLVYSEFQCAICTELFIKAVTLNCSHSFCSLCIKRWKQRTKQCPQCRTPITSLVGSLVLDNFIENMVDKFCEQRITARQELVKCRKQEEIKFDLEHDGNDSENDDDTDEYEEDSEEEEPGMGELADVQTELANSISKVADANSAFCQQRSELTNITQQLIKSREALEGANDDLNTNLEDILNPLWLEIVVASTQTFRATDVLDKLCDKYEEVIREFGAFNSILSRTEEEVTDRLQVITEHGFNSNQDLEQLRMALTNAHFAHNALIGNIGNCKEQVISCKSELNDVKGDLHRLQSTGGLNQIDTRSYERDHVLSRAKSELERVCIFVDQGRTSLYAALEEMENQYEELETAFNELDDSAHGVLNH